MPMMQTIKSAGYKNMRIHNFYGSVKAQKVKISPPTLSSLPKTERHRRWLNSGRGYILAN